MNVQITKQSYHKGLVVLRILACMGVVALHTFGRFSSVESNLSYSIWYLCSLCIPIFFCISGYFALDRDYNLKKAINRIFSILIMVFMWTFALAVYTFLRRGDLTNPIMDGFLSLLQYGNFPRYWYFGALIVLTALAPLLNKFVFNKNSYGEKRIKVLFGCLIVACFISHLINLIFMLRIRQSIYSYELYPHFRQTFRLWIFLVYFVTGGVLHYYEKKLYKILNNKKKAAIGLTMALICLTIAYEQIWVGKLLDFNSPEFHHDSPIVILTTLSVMCLFTILYSSRTDNKILIEMSGATLGVYVLHGWIENVIYKFFVIDSFGLLLVVYFLTAMCSFVAALLMRKIPIIRLFVSFFPLKVFK